MKLCPSFLLHSSILARVLCVFFADSPAEHAVLQRSSEDLECLKLGSIGYNSGICPIFKFQVDLAMENHYFQFFSSLFQWERGKLSSFHHRRILICTVFAFPSLLRPKSLSAFVMFLLEYRSCSSTSSRLPKHPETSRETRRQENPVKTSTNGHSFWTTTARWSRKWRRKPAHMSEVPQGDQGWR